MSKKKVLSLKSYEQAPKERDKQTSERMSEVARRIDKCGSTTLWKVAMRSYQKRLKEGKSANKPNVEEAIEWRGDDSPEGKLALLGLARCCRMQCPLCSYLQSLARRELALKWAKEMDWTGYYGVSLTFTVPHKLSDSETVSSFTAILDNLEKSYKRFSLFFKDFSHARSSSKSLCEDSLGYISALEFTFGKNGLHPHFHTLFLTKSEKDIERLHTFFKKDRVRVWKDSVNSLLRMPAENEEKSFQIIFSPNSENKSPQKMINYVMKGLYETLSSFTKDDHKESSSTSVFDLSQHDMKHFCTFYDATRGKRFYRAGGICKQISKMKDKVNNDDIDASVRSNFDSIIKISAKEHGVPDGLVTDFYERNKVDFMVTFSAMSSEEIKLEMMQRWTSFLMSRLVRQPRYSKKSRENRLSI